MRCTVVAMRHFFFLYFSVHGDSLKEEQNNRVLEENLHAAPMSTVSLHNRPHKRLCAGVICEGANANQLFTGGKSAE